MPKHPLEPKSGGPTLRRLTAGEAFTDSVYYKFFDDLVLTFVYT